MASSRSCNRPLRGICAAILFSPVALATSRPEVTDALAPWLLGARVVQSSIHVASTSVLAVNARFAAFTVQMGIGAYWVWALLVK